MFAENQSSSEIIDAGPPKTMLTEFFELCRIDDFARTIKYHETPEYYIWNNKDKCWVRRKRFHTCTPVSGFDGVFRSTTIGRLYTVTPSAGDIFYLRMVLTTVSGPTSFPHLKTVNDILCETFKDTCKLLGLLGDDTYLENALQEVADTSSAKHLRILFAIIVVQCLPSNIRSLWDKFEEELCGDYLYEMRIRESDYTLPLTHSIKKIIGNNESGLG